MAEKVVTCPETGETECIRFDVHQLGALVMSCTRFEPGRGSACGRMCAAKLDAQQRDALIEIEGDEGDTHVDIDKLITRLRTT